MNKFVIDSKNKNFSQVLFNCISFIKNMPKDKPWEVSIKPYKYKRSSAQNAYLWGVVYKTIADDDMGVFFSEAVEEQLMKSTLKKEEVLHEWLKEKFLPSTDVHGVKIAQSTAKLKTDQFTEYVEQIMAFASQKLGVYIPTPAEKGLADYQKWWGR